MGKTLPLPCELNSGKPEFNPWVGTIPWRRKWRPIQHSCLEDSMDRGARQATVCGITKFSPYVDRQLVRCHFCTSHRSPPGCFIRPPTMLPRDKGSCLPREANGGKVWAPVPRRLSPCWKAHLSFPPGDEPCSNSSSSCPAGL